MNFLKKGIASLALAAMAFMIAPATTFAYLGFSDAAEIPSWAEEAIEELMDQGVLSGNDDGTFAPNRQLNRAEVAKIIVLASGVEFDTYGGPHFPDVAAGDWFFDYVETMYNYGWIDGYPDGYFRPGNGINRVELAKMVINAFEIDLDTTGGPHFSDANPSDWYYTYVETAYNMGLMTGYADGTFGPANAVTRAETARITYDAQLVVAEPTGPAEGTLEVVISDDTPRGTNVPYNATSVPYTTFEFTASDDADVELSTLTITRLGLGDNDDFDSVWLEIDGFKVGNDKSINNDDIVQLRFNPPIVVPAGQTLMADVVASAKYDSNDHNVGHHNRLAVVSADDISSTAANVVGDFPLEGEEMEVASYEVSEITFSALGSDTNIDVGDNFIEVGKFRMLNSSNTNKDVELRAVTFKNDGTAELEQILENVALYVSGEQVSAETIMDGDYITFRLDNGVTGGYVIEDGDSRIFSMRADIVSAEDGDNINFKIDNFEDVVAIEIGTSFGVKTMSGETVETTFSSGTTTTTTDSCTTKAAEDNCARLAAYVIDSGDLNVSRDPASLGNQEYAPGSNDVVFLTARLVVDQPLLVDGVTLKVDDYTIGTSADTLANLNLAFDNFRLFLNDNLVDSANDFEGSTAEPTLVFNTTFEIAGASIMKLVGNITDGAETGTNVKVSLDSGDFLSAEYISTGDQVPSDQLLGSAQASYVEVQVSEVIITKSDGLSTGDKIVAGVDDVTFMQFVLDNNDSGDVNVTSVTVKGTGTGSADTYNEYTTAIFVDGTQQGSSKTLDATTAESTFNDLSVVIPSAGQKEFTVVFNTIEASAEGSETLADSSGCSTDHNNAFDNSGGADSLIVSEDFYNLLEDGDVLYYDGGTTATGAVTKVGADATCTTRYEISLATGQPGNVGDADGDVLRIKHTMGIEVVDVDADNVENGQEVDVVKTAGGAAVSATNTVAGVTFELVNSGSVHIQEGTDVAGAIMVAETNDVEVMRYRFSAVDDEIQVKDLYFCNDSAADGCNNMAAAEEAIGDRVDFKLYNEAGQLIQEKTMTGGNLHFELGNADRISVPKDGTTFVTLKVDVRDITKANQTGKLLKVALDTFEQENGIEGVTAATGSDLEDANVTTGIVAGNTFVAYRTKPTIDLATLPSSVLTGGTDQEIFRFSVSADSAGAIKLGRVTLKLTADDADAAAATALSLTNFSVEDVTESNNVYTVLNTADAAITLNNAGPTANAIVNFKDLLIDEGETKTFKLLADISGTAEDDSLSTQFLEDTAMHASAPFSVTNPTTTGFTHANVPYVSTTSNIVWADESSLADDDYLGGYLVKPNTDSVTVTK